MKKFSWKRRLLSFTPAEWAGFEVMGMGGKSLSDGQIALAKVGFKNKCDLYGGKNVVN